MSGVFGLGTSIAFRQGVGKISTLTARTDAGIQIRFAVVSTKGTSAGSVAGVGLMAKTGRAPMLSADYSIGTNLYSR